MVQAGVQLDPNAAWVLAVIKTATTQGGVEEVRRQEVTERENNIVVLVAQPKKTATGDHPRQ